MKKHKKFSTKILSLALSMAMLFTVLPTTVFAEKNNTPTRNTMLDVSALTETTDMFTSEGWKWEPAADGGILTLRNCYIQTQETKSLQLPDGNVTIILEGENTIETTSNLWSAMIESPGAGGVAALNLTIAAGTKDGKLNILRKDASSGSTPYAIAGNTITIQSGDIYANTEFCVIKSNFTMQEGSLKVDVANVSDGNGIYSVEGNVNISGGNLDIDAGQIGIYVPGNSNKGGEKVSLTGGDVKIRSITYGIAAKSITVNTNGNLDLQGNNSALYCFKTGGTLEILAAGSLTLSGTKPYLPESTSDEKPVIIGGAGYTAVDELINEANGLISDDYKDFSGVEAAIGAVTRGKSILEQNTVNGYATAIKNAIDALKYKDADYTKVDDAILRIPTDLSNYTDESVKTLNDAKGEVVRGKNITEQAIVDGYATAIEDALKALKYKGADYSKVDAAIAKIPSDLSSYTANSVKTLNDAKGEVVRDKNITEQAIVDGYAVAIEDAMINLKKKPVISITNPETDIKVEYDDGTLLDADIVLSVTSKPQAEMDRFKDNVDKAASGLVLGGLYDVKLLKDGVAIQPDGKIKVSIPLTDAMKAMTNLQVVYIDDNGNVTVVQSEVKDGMITFVTDHFSDYGVIGKVKATDTGNNNSNNGNTNSPQTGDNSPMLLFVLMMCASGTVLVVLGKKKKVFTHLKK